MTNPTLDEIIKRVKEKWSLLTHGDKNYFNDYYEDSIDTINLLWLESVEEGIKIGEKKAQKEFLDLLDKRFNDTLSSLDSQFCKTEKDAIERNYALKIIEELKKAVKTDKRT